MYNILLINNQEKLIENNIVKYYFNYKNNNIFLKFSLKPQLSAQLLRLFAPNVFFHHNLVLR